MYTCPNSSDLFQMHVNFISEKAEAIYLYEEKYFL